MQIPVLYGILLLLTYLLHYAILIGGVSFTLEKSTRILGGLTIATDLLLLFGQTLIEGCFFFNNLSPYFWLVLPLSVAATIAAIWTYIKLGGKRLLDQGFRKRYAKIFAVLFWVFLAGAWFKSVWGIH